MSIVPKAQTQGGAVEYVDRALQWFFHGILRGLCRISNQSNFFWARICLYTAIFLVPGLVLTLGLLGVFALYVIDFKVYPAVIEAIRRLEQWRESDDQSVCPLNEYDYRILTRLRVISAVFGFCMSASAVYFEFLDRSPDTASVFILLMNIPPLLIGASIYFTTDFQPKRPSRLKAAARKLRQALTPKPRFVPRPTFGFFLPHSD